MAFSTLNWSSPTWSRSAFRCMEVGVPPFLPAVIGKQAQNINTPRRGSVSSPALDRGFFVLGCGYRRLPGYFLHPVAVSVGR